MHSSSPDLGATRDPVPAPPVLLHAWMAAGPGLDPPAAPEQEDALPSARWMLGPKAARAAAEAVGEGDGSAGSKALARGEEPPAGARFGPGGNRARGNKRKRRRGDGGDDGADSEPKEDPSALPVPSDKQLAQARRLRDQWRRRAAERVRNHGPRGLIASDGAAKRGTPPSAAPADAGDGAAPP